MSRKEIYQLLQKHLEGSISSEESILLEEVIDKTHVTILEEVLTEILDDSNSNISECEIDHKRINFNDVWNQIQHSNISIQENLTNKKSNKYIYYLMTIAAVSIGVFFLFNNIISPEFTTDEYGIQDIDPAQPLAKIKLANGEELIIDSIATGLVYEKDGISMFRTDEGIIEYVVDSNKVSSNQFITVSTPKGGFTKVTLSDGSLVILNSASSITYPVSFHNSNKRLVNAEGEIYFEIAKNKNTPFIINSEKQDIEVLGTSFNLLTTENEAKTTLIEGSVKIRANNTEYFLKPGQQSIVNSTVKIIDINANHAVAWTNDQFVFDNGSFYDLLKEIENWYNVRFVFERDDIKNLELSGSLSRKVKLSELLNVLSINTGYKFEIIERRIYVK